MKKIISLFLLLSMSIFFVSCSDENKNDKITNENQKEKISNQKDLHVKKDHEKGLSKNNLQNALKKEFSYLKDVNVNNFSCIKIEDDISKLQCSGDIDLIGNFRDKIVSNINLVNLNGSWKIDNKDLLEEEITLKIMGWQTKKTYWEDGSLKSSSHVDNNSLVQGNVKAYDKDGSIITDAFFKDNKPLNGFIKVPSKRRDIGFKFELNATYKDGNVQNGYEIKSNSIDVYRDGKLLDEKDILYVINYLDKNVQKGLLEGTPESIKYLNDLTVEKKLWATSINPATIKYIKNPTEKIILNAIDYASIYILRDLENPSELIQNKILIRFQSYDFEDLKHSVPDTYSRYMNKIFTKSSLGIYHKLTGNYSKALEILNDTQDNVYSQYHLGMMYLEGIGVDINKDHGMELIEKSANNGVIWAQIKMGDINFDKKNYKSAIDWYLKANKQGYNDRRTLYGLFKVYKVIKDLDNFEKTSLEIFELIKYNESRSYEFIIEVAEFYYNLGHDVKAKDWYSKLSMNKLFKRLDYKPNKPLLKAGIEILDKKTLNGITAKNLLKVASILRFGKNEIEKDHISAYKYFRKIYKNPNSKKWKTSKVFRITAFDEAKVNMYEICIDNKYIDHKKFKDSDEAFSKCDIIISEKL